MTRLPRATRDILAWPLRDLGYVANELQAWAILECEELIGPCVCQPLALSLSLDGCAVEDLP